jgi:hypothetical protein
LGNITGEYPPKILFLCDSAIKMIGPLMSVLKSLLERKLCSDARNFKFSWHLNGRIFLSFSSFEYSLISFICSSGKMDSSRPKKSFVNFFGVIFAFCFILLTISSETYFLVLMASILGK